MTSYKTHNNENAILQSQWSITNEKIHKNKNKHENTYIQMYLKYY